MLTSAPLVLAALVAVPHSLGSTVRAPLPGPPPFLKPFSPSLRLAFGARRTLCFDPTFEPLLEACREATDTGIRAAGIDQPLNEIGELIQETMESYEVRESRSHA